MKCRSTQSRCHILELVSLQKPTKIRADLCKPYSIFLRHALINVILFKNLIWWIEMCFTVIVLSSMWSTQVTLKTGVVNLFCISHWTVMLFPQITHFVILLAANLCTSRRMWNKNGWCFKADCLFWIQGSLLLAKGSNSLKLITTQNISLQPHKWMWWFHWYWFCWNCWCDWAFKPCQWTKT